MHFLGSVWNCIRFDISSVFSVLFQCKQKKINMRVPKHLQLQQFSERRVAFSDRIARVPIFLAMTVYIYMYVRLSALSLHTDILL